ncbi:MAG TPA: T9SS type A sorting domain-containing protein [Chitinophagales bacterium]|nr:T9SS type A sorting domain-containing protein [Chitinophagales bacterium]
MKNFSLLKKKLALFIVVLVLAAPVLKKCDAQILPCIDNFEPNNEKTQATQIGTNVEYQALISTPLDVDWFKFNVTSQEPNILISLVHFFQDYNIFLYDSTKLQIGSSKNRGTKSDTITINGLLPGKYLIKVRARAGQFDLNYCYTLKVKSSATANRAVAVTNSFVNDKQQFELYPNPVADKLIVLFDDKISSASFCIYNFIGQKISEIKAAQLDENATAELDVSALSAGEYFLKINYDAGTEVKKFIVSK